MACRVAAICSLVAASAMAPATPARGAPGDDVVQFRLTVDVDGLYPGQRRDVEVWVTNPSSFALLITSIEVTARDVTPECSGSLLRFGPLAQPVGMLPAAQAPISLPLVVSPSTPDACQGATWSVDLAATAVIEDVPADSPAATGSPGTLPSTGFGLAVPTALAVAALVGGLAVLVASRRRT